MYDADDERAWSFKPGRFDRWTLRDLGGKVLRTYEATAYNWTGSVAEDDIYRDGQLLAAETSAGTRHFHLDHLGTPRLMTNSTGAQAAYHVYYPFGEEATAFNQDTERMKFTGHERDLASPAGPGDDLDYMHARHCSPVTGRFLSVDPIGGTPKRPQSWNRYLYVGDNPMNATDPTGRQTGNDLANKTDSATSGLITTICSSPNLGILCAPAQTTKDLITSYLRMGTASGDKVGSQAGPIAIGAAFFGDLLTATSFAAPAMGALKATAGEELGTMLSSRIGSEGPRASTELLDAVRAHGRTITIATEGSEELRFLNAVGAEASVGGPGRMSIILREDPSRSAVMEEFLHGTQERLGIINRLGIQGAERHVTDFMVRHGSLLGLE